MGDLIVTNADVGAEMAVVAEMIAGLDGVFASCPALTAATQSEWTAFKQSWATLEQNVADNVIPVTPWTPGIAISFSLPFVTLAAVEGFQTELLKWQQIAEDKCGAQGPKVTPHDNSDPAWLTALKWGGGALVVVGGLFALAPLIETIVGSAAAARSAGATKRLLTGKRKENPIRGAAVEVGTIGDVNFLEYSGGPVLRTEHGYAVEWVEPPPDEIDFDSKRARWTVYRVDLDQEVPTLLDVDAAAETSGMSGRALREQFLSSDPMVRASAYWTLANHFGWGELDQYSLSLKKAEVYRRYGEELELENPM